MFDLIIKKGVCLLPHPQNPNTVIEEQVDIAVKNGRIEQIGRLYMAKAKEEFFASGLHILPGLIDTQVHFREPGLEHKETLYHGSLSALKGGMSAFFEMPNTLPPTAQPADLEEKIKRAEKNSWCDFAFYLGAVQDNKTKLNEIENRPACPGVKIFLGNSTGNLALEDEASLNTVFSQRRRITAIHSEDETRLKNRRYLTDTKPPHARNHPLWRDAESALISTKRVIALAKKYKKPVHILHVSTKEEIEFLTHHKNIASIEVTPQHLSLQAPECYERLGSLVQMNPPIRDKTHQLALWRALQSGVIDIIGSDHAPHTLKEKQKTYPDSPSGMPGTQTMLPLMLNHINEKKLDLKLLVRLLAHNPSQRFQIKNQGQIKVGNKAHFTIVDLKTETRIESNWLASKCGWSPFEGWKIKGWPRFVFLYGKKAMAENTVLGQPSGGPILFHDVT